MSPAEWIEYFLELHRFQHEHHTAPAVAVRLLRCKHGSGPSQQQSEVGAKQQTNRQRRRHRRPPALVPALGHTEFIAERDAFHKVPQRRQAQQTGSESSSLHHMRMHISLD